MIQPNATDTGDYLWTNMIVGEIFPVATTPSTWSVWEELLGSMSFGDTPAFGQIGGRPYLNYSLTYSFLLKIARSPDRAMGMIKDSIGVPPAGVEIPSFPIPWRVVLFQVLPRELKNERKKGRLRADARGYLATVRDRCRELRRRIDSAQGEELISLWTNDIRPLWREIHLLQDKMNEELHALNRQLRKALTPFLGEHEASQILTTITSAGELASLGPLIGLGRLCKGELSRDEYLRRYGHRGPDENELAVPRPHEDREWLDKQLAEHGRSALDVTARLEARDAEFEVARGEITSRLPSRKARSIERAISAIAEANTLREEARSELTRVVDLIRALFLRVGHLTNLGDGVFYLTIHELPATLYGSNSGDVSPAADIAARQQAYRDYRALPPLPAWIRGRFDPFQWALDPNRRRDVFDAQAAAIAPILTNEGFLKGQPGSAGRVEGMVRRIDSPADGDQLQQGEILVATTTNVGWTPLFPRASAVVTDVGGSLSHAAIVARELGIPAVVGCGDATIRLKTGQRVRVDGAEGTIEILPRAA